VGRACGQTRPPNSISYHDKVRRLGASHRSNRNCSIECHQPPRCSSRRARGDKCRSAASELGPAARQEARPNGFEAVRRILSVSRTLAVFAIIVDAKDDRAIAFYESFGFRVSRTEKPTFPFDLNRRRGIRRRRGLRPCLARSAKAQRRRLSRKIQRGCARSRFSHDQDPA
jgi:hypothetical protein